MGGSALSCRGIPERCGSAGLAWSDRMEKRRLWSSRGFGRPAEPVSWPARIPAAGSELAGRGNPAHADASANVEVGSGDVGGVFTGGKTAAFATS